MAQNQEFEAFTILNGQGEVWTQAVFETENAAQNHIANAVKSWAKDGLHRHKVVPCTVTIKPHAE